MKDTIRKLSKPKILLTPVKHTPKQIPYYQTSDYKQDLKEQQIRAQKIIDRVRRENEEYRKKTYNSKENRRKRATRIKALKEMGVRED